MKRATPLIWLLLILTVCGLHAQPDDQERQLRQALEQAPDDSTRVERGVALAKFYLYTPDSLYKYASEALELAERTGCKTGIASAANALLLYYSAAKQEDNAIRMHHKILDNDPDDETRINLYTNLILIYAEHRNFEQAMRYADLLAECAGDSRVLRSLAYTCRAKVFMAREQADSVEVSRDMAVGVMGEPQSKFEVLTKITTLLILVSIQNPEGQYESMLAAKKLYEEKKLNNLPLYTTILSTYGMACLALLQSDGELPRHLDRRRLLAEAEEYLLQAKKLQEELFGEDHFQMGVFSRNLYQLYALKGDYRRAYEWLLTYHEVSDAYYSQENKNKLAAVEVERQAEQFEHEMSLAQLELDLGKRQRALFVTAIFLLLVIVALLIRFNVIRQRNNKKLAEANELKNRLFGILNHDLRKPVSHLVEYLKFNQARPGVFSEEVKKEAEKETLEMSERLLQSMEELLSWSKSQMTNFAPEYREIPIRKLFSDVAILPDGKRVDIAIPAGKAVVTDASYMRAIIRNLTSNALRATKDVPQPMVKWTAEEGDDRTVRLTISDNGPGMTEAQMRMLTDGASATNLSTGLGLHITHDLAGRIGCRIEVDRGYTKGLRVSLSLPRTGLSA